MSSIKLVLRSDKVNKNSGKAPLYLRIIKDRKTTFISLGQQLEPQFWDEDRQRVKKSYPNSARMNAFLAQKVSETEQKILEENQKNRNVTTKNLKTSIIGKEPAKFFEFTYKRLEIFKSTDKISTYMTYYNAINKFEKFIGHKNLYFEDININLLKDFEQYLIVDLKNSRNTVNYKLKFRSKIFTKNQ